MWLAVLDLDGVGNFLLGVAAILAILLPTFGLKVRHNGKTARWLLEECQEERDQARRDANSLRKRLRGRSRRS